MQSQSNETTKMTIDVKEGQLLVDEGSIFWRYIAVDDEEDGGRPVVVFMHAGVTDHSLWYDNAITSE